MRAAIVWAHRVLWAALALTLGPALGAALSDRSRPVQLTGTIGAWVWWAVVLLAGLVPTTASLTVVRSLAPGAALVGVLSWVAGASTGEGAAAVATAAASGILAFSGEFGEAFVQGSAYGDEQRFPLRPPGPVLVIVPVLWSAAAVALLVGALATAAGNWVVGPVVLAVGLALSVALAPRLHRLSRRWLVIVPAGVVLHDHLVLAETVMAPRTAYSHAALAPVGTDAMNLTGLALGPAVELQVREPLTFVLAAPRGGRTSAVHATGFLVGPTRPGRLLDALRSAGIPVS